MTTTRTGEQQQQWHEMLSQDSLDIHRTDKDESQRLYAAAAMAYD